LHQVGTSSLLTNNFRIYTFLLIRLAADTQCHRFNIAVRFSIKQFYVLPTQLYLCVLCGSEKKTAIISLYNINCPVCITKMECVYCAVRTGCLCLV